MEEKLEVYEIFEAKEPKVCVGIFFGANREKHAKLFEASPKLLGALQEALSELKKAQEEIFTNYTDELIEKIESVIKKATE